MAQQRAMPAPGGSNSGAGIEDGHVKMKAENWTADRRRLATSITSIAQARRDSHTIAEDDGGALYEQLPPSNHDYEAKAIGLALKFAEALPGVQAALPDPEACLLETHREILKAMYFLADNGAPVEVCTVASRLDQTKKLEAVGGSAYLQSLVNDAGPGEYAAAWYASKVRELADKRRIGQELTDAAAMVYRPEDIPAKSILQYVDGVVRDETARLAAADGEEVRRFHSMTLAEARTLPKPVPLLGRILWKEAIHMLYAEPSTWKSFVALAMALCIATGRDWLGQPVEQGPVLYIAAEAANLLMWNALVWLNYHGFYGADADAVPFRIIALDVPDLSDQQQVRDFINTTLDEFTEYYDRPPVLIVDDTLSASMSKDENVARDINEVYRHLRLVQRELGSSALIVHHIGKDASKEYRGSSALLGNADCTMSIDTGNVAGGDLEPGSAISLVNKKPYKGAAKFAPVHLTTKAHTLIEDDGKQYTSLVIVPSTCAPDPKPGKEPAGDKHAGNLLAMMRNDYPVGATDSVLEQAFMARYNVSDITYKRAKKVLVSADNIRNEGGLWLPC